MAQKVTFKRDTKGGETINVYGELCESPEGVPQVRVWTKYQNLGFYNLDRLPGATLTRSNLESFLFPGGN